MDKIYFRKISIGSGVGPKTIDEEKRSVSVIAATESRVKIYDWDRGPIDEILLMSGMQVPENNQLPLLDAHNRWGTADIIGSLRDIKIGKKDMRGTAVFSSLAEDQWTKVREGHLTDFSIGYVVNEAQYADEGESIVIDGRTFKGPVKVVTNTSVKELSSVPVGADDKAKSRNYQGNEREDKMKKTPEQLEAERLAKEKEENRSEVVEKVVEKIVIEKVVDEDEVTRRADELDAYRTEVRMMCRKLNRPEEEAEKFIADKTSIADVGRALFAKMGEGDDKGDKKPGDGFGFARAHVVDDQQDKFRDGASLSLLMRIGKEPIDGKNNFLSMTTLELARKCCELNGLPTTGTRRDIVARANMGTSDFPYILSNTANKSFFDAYETADETHKLWTGERFVSSFKIHESPRISGTGRLEEILTEDSEPKYGSRSEAQETYRLREFRKVWGWSYRAQVDDDLGAFSDMADYGEAAALTEGDVAWEALTDNANMGDGNALFSTTHGNLEATATELPSIDSMTAARLAMRLQTGVDGETRIKVAPMFLMIPAAIESHVEQFFGSKFWYDEATQGTIDAAMTATRENPFYRPALQVIVETRLDDDSSTAWYLAGKKGKTVDMVYLNGQRTPNLRTVQNQLTDAIEILCHHNVSAFPVAWNWMFKNPGA
jgi:hypothetical protein